MVPPMLLKNWLLQKLQFCYKNDLEKISRSLLSIGNFIMLLCSKFHISELSLSKVKPVQILLVRNGKSPQNFFFIMWYLLSILPELRCRSQRTSHDYEAALCVPWASFNGLPSPTPWKNSASFNCLPSRAMQSWHFSGRDWHAARIISSEIALNSSVIRVCKSATFCGRTWKTRSLRYPQRKKSAGVKSGERAGHS